MKTFKETLVEKKVTIDVDHTGEDIKTAERKYKIKIKHDGETQAYITGEKKDVLRFLKGPEYSMDTSDIKEFFPELYESLDEALDLKQRMKAKQTFRKNKAKIAIGKKRAEKKIASPEKLKARARKGARKAVEKMILKNKSKEDLSFSQRQALEKRVDAKKGAIDRIAKKILPAVKKAELEKKRGGTKKDEK